MKPYKTVLTAVLLLAALNTPALAMEYEVTGPPAGDFGTPTSVSPVTIIGEETIFEADVSKNTALNPPPFGSTLAQEVNFGASATGYTPLAPDHYFGDSHLGTLSAPAIGMNLKVYQGIGNGALSKGVGHFESTSLWDGNVAFAGHNRGVNNHFGAIHTLKVGDTLQWSTKLGTRTYQVFSVRQVASQDISVLGATSENQITLITCVKNQPNNRWCIQARQTGSTGV